MPNVFVPSVMLVGECKTANIMKMGYIGCD